MARGMREAASLCDAVLNVPVHPEPKLITYDPWDEERAPGSYGMSGTVSLTSLGSFSVHI